MLPDFDDAPEYAPPALTAPQALSVARKALGKGVRVFRKGRACVVALGANESVGATWEAALHAALTNAGR